MELTWYGQSCFKIKDKNISIITDPYGEIGLDLPKISADIVTISHGHFDHNAKEKIEGEPFIINSPGEYEVKGVFIDGIGSEHDKKKGEIFGANTIFVFHLEDLVVCHLGDLGEKLDSQKLDQIGNVDVLLVPVGGKFTLDVESIVNVINEIEPKIVIPMHYKIEGLNIELDDVAKFKEAIGAEATEVEGALKLQKKDLPEEGMLVHILKP